MTLLPITIPPTTPTKKITVRKKRPRRQHHSIPIEISGQCSVCKDFFTILVFVERGEQHVQETTRVKYVGGEGTEEPRRLVHRPELCNGDITLYGSPEQFKAFGENKVW